MGESQPSLQRGRAAKGHDCHVTVNPETHLIQDFGISNGVDASAVGGMTPFGF